MYTITAKSCDSQNIHFSITGTLNAILECRDHLCQAFRFVEVTCDETGEVMFTGYQSEEFFNAILAPDSAIMLCIRDVNYYKEMPS